MYVKTGETLPLPTLHLQATQGRAWHVERLGIAVAGVFNVGVIFMVIIYSMHCSHSSGKNAMRLYTI